MSAKLSLTTSLWSSNGAREYGHRDGSSWKGMRVRGAGEVLMRGGAGLVGVGTATAAITIGTDPEGAGKQAGTDVATVGRTDGAERWVRGKG